MSGIFGICNWTEECTFSSDDNLSRMASWNRAYGDDVEDYYRFEGLSMGIFGDRLNNCLTKSKGVVKMNNWIAVIDALIFNRNEIIEELNKTTPRDIPDDELVLRFIDSYGFEAIKKINGDFSGAIFNTDDKSLTLFRDHIGIRPLFYYCKGGLLAFSTDLRGIIANTAVDVSLNEEWIYRTIEGFTSNSPESTEFENILCIKPGSYSKFNIEGKKITQKKTTYWTIGSRKIRMSSDHEYQNRLRKLIEDSIRIRLNSVSGMVGAELSGGLDSGVIDILINRFGRKCLYYSWSFSPDELEYAESDERLVIKDICDQEGITCLYGHLNLDSDSIMQAKYCKAGLKTDDDVRPEISFALPPYVNTLSITQTSEDLAKKGAKAIFTGHGGDEGVSHRLNPYEMFYNHEYYHYFRFMFSTTHGQKHRIFNTFKKVHRNLTLDRSKFLHPFIEDADSSDFINAEFASHFNVDEMPVLSFAYDPVEYIKNGGSRDRLDNIAIQGAYSGVRYLVPYLDYRVVDFAVSIPRYQFIRGHKNRYIYREAFKDIIPKSLYNLKIKMDYSFTKIKSDPNWFKTFDIRKKDIISRLDRTYWDKYLNFEKIDEFARAGKPENEDIEKHLYMRDTLYTLLVAQNLLEKVRL